MAKGPNVLARLTLPAKLGVGTLTLVLTTAVYFVVFYNDVQTNIAAAAHAEQNFRQELATARSAEHAYQKDLAELADREQRQRDLNKILPSTTEYPAFLSAVQNVANQAGILLSAWTPQAEVPGEFYNKVPMLLEVSGKYHQIAKFFYSVGQLDRIINMENISITEPKVVGDDIVLQVKALATAFHSGAVGGGGP